MGRSIPERLNDATIAALICRADQWPRGLLTTQAIPDAWMGLILRRDGARRFIPAGETPRLEEGDRLLLVRNRAFTIPVEVRDAAAQCENTVSGSAELLVRWQPHEDDLGALHRGLLADGELSLDGLSRAVVEAGGARSAFLRFLRQKPAAELVHDDQRAGLADALRESLKKFLFETGLTLDRVNALSLHSASLARAESHRRDAAHRVQQIQSRALVEDATLAAARRRLEGLSGIFEKLRAAAADGQQTRWHELLPALSPAERGQLLANLWRVTPDLDVATGIVVVAGTQCLWLDPTRPEEIARRVTVDDSLGGLRSIAFDAQRGWLLLGAGRGVWALDAEDGAVLHKFAAATTSAVRNGFNAAVIAHDRVYATHSQLGLWRWSLAAAADGRAILEPADGMPGSIRAAVLACDGRVLFAADDCLQAVSPADDALSVITSVGAEISAVNTLDQQVFLGLTDGKLLKLDLRYPDDLFVPYRGSGPLESIEVRRWNDLVELVVPAGASGIVGVYGEEGTVARLLGSSAPIRRAWASDDCIVGLTDRRDRLLVLNANLPETTPREAAISRLVGHSIQDVCIATRRAAAPVA
jgi:hypothetical protein